MTAWLARRGIGTAGRAFLLPAMLLAMQSIVAPNGAWAAGAAGTVSFTGEVPVDSAAQAASLEASGEASAATEDWSAALSSWEAALAIRMELAKAAPRDPDRMRDLAAVQEKVGRAQGALEHHDAAAASLGAAQKLRATLLKAAPKDEVRQRDLAAVGLALAEALLMADREEEAIKPVTDAVKAMRALLKASPGDMTAAFDLAGALVGDARVRLALGRQEEAAERAEEARGMFMPLTDANSAARHGLTRALNVLGSAALERDDFDAAKTAFQESFSTAEAGPPGDATDLDRAAALERLGWVAQRRGEAAESLRAYEWSRSIYSAVAGRQPRHVDAAFNAASLANRLGMAKTEAGDTAVALVLHGEALTGFRALVAVRPEIWRYRRGIVEALRGQANAGDAPAQRLQQALDLVVASKAAGVLPDAEAWIADDLREALAEAK